LTVVLAVSIFNEAIEIHLAMHFENFKFVYGCSLTVTADSDIIGKSLKGHGPAAVIGY